MITIRLVKLYYAERPSASSWAYTKGGVGGVVEGKVFIPQPLNIQLQVRDRVYGNIRILSVTSHLSSHEALHKCPRRGGSPEETTWGWKNYGAKADILWSVTWQWRLLVDFLMVTSFINKPEYDLMLFNTWNYSTWRKSFSGTLKWYNTSNPSLRN